MIEKRLTVILHGCDRNLWRGGPVRIRVSDIFAAGGPQQMFEGTANESTIQLRLQLPFDAGQVYGFDFSAPDHRPAWQLIRRADFIRGDDGREIDEIILRLMLAPNKTQSSDLPEGFQRLLTGGSPIAAPGAGLDEPAFQLLTPAARMALLNIDAKLKETFVNGASLLSFVKGIRHVAVDRLFLFLDPALKTQLDRSPDFASAPGHPASAKLGTPAHPDSWKHRRFGEGNVQLSFSRETESLPDGLPVHSVDVDIDLGRGLAHVVEWLENNVFSPGHKTDQTLIYGLLFNQGILPLYTLDPIAATTARIVAMKSVKRAAPRKAAARPKAARAAGTRAAGRKPRTPRTPRTAAARAKRPAKRTKRQR